MIAGYVYKHAGDSGVVFYVGKTKTKTRPYQVSGRTRSAKWREAYEKHCGSDRSRLKTEVIKCETEGEALKLEWDLIVRLKPEGNSQYIPKDSPTHESLLDVILKVSEDQESTDSKSVNLNELIAVANNYRATSGEPSIRNITEYVNRGPSKKFLAECEKRMGEPALRKEGAKNATKYWCSLHYAIWVAEDLSPASHYDVVDVFLASKILELRDISGDAHNELIYNLKTNYDVEGSELNSIMVDISLILQNVIQPAMGSWNRATAQQLTFRTRLLDDLSAIARSGVVSDIRELPKLIPNFVKPLKSAIDEELNLIDTKLSDF